MPLAVMIPDDVAAALRLPPRSREEDLRRELAIHLYAEGLLPEASACRLAGMSRIAFQRLLGERRVPASYTPEDLDRDLETLSWMRAVSNTSPLSSLIQIGQLVVLGELFERVFIPPQVAAELDEGAEYFGDWRGARGAGVIETRWRGLIAVIEMCRDSSTVSE